MACDFARLLQLAVLLLVTLSDSITHGQQPVQASGLNGQRLSSGQRRWLRSASGLALRQLRQTGPESNTDKLGIVVLLTDLDRRDKDRPTMLRAALKMCAAHLFPTTPSSVYIFTHQRQVEYLEQALGDMLLPNVAVLPIANASWVVPALAGDPAGWHSKMPIDYRLMGDWRLDFMPSFVREMGHRYLLQIDDDSFILSPVGQNLVQLFDQQGYVLAARQRQRDPPSVTWGMPELARYYLTTHKVVPTMLFEFCDPPNIEGLYSEFGKARLQGTLSPMELAAAEQLGLKQSGGWNRTILYGNCLMYSLDWWFRPEVNRFVQLCRASGGSFAYRWNEQGVIAMLWQIFVKPQQFYEFPFDYAHRITPDAALARLGTSSSGG